MAAGLGFKTFTSGEVLTAADTNGYLMQGINVFANASARSAAITSPQEGQYSYLKDTNSTEYYDGAAWVAGVEGDISGVTAGVGISGGGTSGTVTVTNSMATTITTKGDLVPGTGSGTFARLAAGSNGETLVADSSTSTGLRYQANYAAGKNVVINGGFDIWQRSTSSSTVPAYSTADRWYNGGSGTVTFSQDTDIPSGVTVQYSSKWLTSASSSYGQYYYAFEQAIVKPLRNQQVILSYYIKSAGSQAGNIVTAATYSNSTDALSSQLTAITSTGDTSYAASTVTSWTRKSITFTVPADAVGLRFSIVPGSVQASAVSNFLTGVQLEIGATATAFSRNSSTIQSELAACQRYYYRFVPVAGSGGNYYGPYAVGGATSTTNAYVTGHIPVAMRSAPTFNRSGSQIYNSASNIAVTALSNAWATGTSFSINVTVASGLTAGQVCHFAANNNSADYFDLSAEL